MQDHVCGISSGHLPFRWSKPCFKTYPNTIKPQPRQAIKRLKDPTEVTPRVMWTSTGTLLPGSTSSWVWKINKGLIHWSLAHNSWKSLAQWVPVKWNDTYRCILLSQLASGARLHGCSFKSIQCRSSQVIMRRFASSKTLLRAFGLTLEQQEHWILQLRGRLGHKMQFHCPILYEILVLEVVSGTPGYSYHLLFVPSFLITSRPGWSRNSCTTLHFPQLWH